MYWTIGMISAYDYSKIEAALLLDKLGWKAKF
jgi:hypothetical protein